MAKKKLSRKSNTNSVIFGIIGIVVVVLGIFFVSIEWNKRIKMENVKGDATESSRMRSCNMTVRPARTCPSGFECRQTSLLKGSDGVCIKKNLANAGEACGKSIGMGCKKELLCAPLAPSYKLLAVKAMEAETAAETETVSADVVKCIGKTENEIKSGCLPYIPYYGACVKKGVWPPKVTPIPTQTPPSGCRYQTVQCIKAPCNPVLVCPSGIITPTPTPSSTTPGTVSCGWCDGNCFDTTYAGVCANESFPVEYSCENINNTCVKVKK
ncbi:MAG: hypothetical protein V1917_00185 [Candidatus Gottesmanbacteria bacterium]